MEIAPQFDDDPEFVQQVELAVNGILRRFPPASLVLIKINNWFDWKWRGFSGTVFIGRTARPGAWLIPSDRRPRNLIRIPPFVPERVVLQRRFAAPNYQEIDPGKPVHREIPSRIARKRTAAIEEPDAALAWYSGNSKANGRGTLMVYLPDGSSYWPWFVQLKRGEPWRITKAKGITPDHFSRLVEEGSNLSTGSTIG
ncbi:MAG: hypothetical protein ACLQGT_04430 [Terracidiphilus sp.]